MVLMAFTVRGQQSMEIIGATLLPGAAMENREKGKEKQVEA